MNSNRVAIIFSGRGSNMAALLSRFDEGLLDIQPVILITDNPQAAGLKFADKFGIPAKVLDPKQFATKADYEQALVDCLTQWSVDWVVLAGYMRLLGQPVIDAFDKRILNIHPSLLPAFKGLRAQQQALDYGVKFSGATVHFVTRGMDEGPIILQAVVPVFSDDTEQTLGERILLKEHEIYAQAVQLAVQGRLKIEGRLVTVI